MPNFLQRLIRPFLLGAFFAILTWVFFNLTTFHLATSLAHHGFAFLDYVIVIFLFPGTVISIFTTNIANDPSVIAMALGNFVFYFLLGCLLWARRPKFKLEKI